MTSVHSLRARVAVAAALGALIITVALGLLVMTAIERNNLRQIDQQLETASRLVVLNPDIAVAILRQLGPPDQLTLTVRRGSTLTGTTPVELPEQPAGSDTIEVGGVPYRVLTLETNGGQTVSLGLPAEEARSTTRRQQRWVLGAGFLTIGAAAGLGWIFGGRAVRPIVDLTRRVAARPPQPMPNVTGVREATELAAEINAMLERVDAAQAETTSALTAARDFAAASAHELRTPLTAMRTDIEVLRTLEMDAAQRDEILDDLQRAQNRVEATLGALERLASGELTSEREFVETDLVEVCDLATYDARRHFPDLDVHVEAEHAVLIRGVPAGLRLALDNAIGNAVRHGSATAVVITVTQTADYARITVDDNGTGIPTDERTAVFERFRRGSRATVPGSGLGLALVAQQAQLHGGSAEFADSPLGGVRLVVTLRGTTDRVL